MKNIIWAILSIVAIGQAATAALYLHHERSSQATVEADCQNREVCLDKINLAPLGRFNDGTLYHLVSQEKPNVNLSGTLTVTGAATLSNNLTLSLISANRVPYTTTGGLVTSSANLTYNGTTLAVNNGTYSGTLGVTGVSTFIAAPVFSSGTASQTMELTAGKALTTVAITGTGSYMKSISPTTTGTLAAANGTYSGTLGVTGLSTLTGGFTAALTSTASKLVTTSDFTIGATNLAAGSPFIYNAGTGQMTLNPDQLTIGLAVGATISLTKAVSMTSTLAVTGTVTADSLISAKFYAEGPFSAVGTGFSACGTGSYSAGTCTVTGSYVRVGKMVTINIPDIYGTSNTTACTITGLPAGVAPPSQQALQNGNYQITNNGAAVWVTSGYYARVETSGTITLLNSFSATGFTSSGTKGIQNGLQNTGTRFTYTLQ